MDDIPGVEWRDGEFVIPAVSREIGNPLFNEIKTLVEIDNEKLNKVEKLISHYEIREATTLFELALWKARIDQTAASTNPSSYTSSRTEVPGPVKDVILQYLRPC